VKWRADTPGLDWIQRDAGFGAVKRPKPAYEHVRAVASAITDGDVECG
jgi:hypothetical protein